MTIEEIKAEMNRVKDKLDPLDLIEIGWRECLEWVLFDLLNNLEPSWHEYPKEKPTEDGPYLVTWGNEYPIVGKFEEGTFCFDKVIAWADLPKPYKKDGTT